MTPEQTRDLIKFLFAAYPTQRQKMRDEDAKAMFHAYSIGLADLDATATLAALKRIVLSDRWIPTIADIRAAVGVVMHGEQSIAIEQWGEVLRRQRKFGQSRPPGVENHPPFEDPITAQVVAAMTWFELCASKSSAADRARFIEAYEQMQLQERRQAQLSAGGTSSVLPVKSQISIEQREHGERGLGDIVAGMLPKGSTL